MECNADDIEFRKRVVKDFLDGCTSGYLARRLNLSEDVISEWIRDPSLVNEVRQASEPVGSAVFSTELKKRVVRDFLDGCDVSFLIFMLDIPKSFISGWVSDQVLLNEVRQAAEPVEGILFSTEFKRRVARDFLDGCSVDYLVQHADFLPVDSMWIMGYYRKYFRERKVQDDFLKPMVSNWTTNQVLLDAVCQAAEPVEGILFSTEFKKKVIKDFLEGYSIDVLASKLCLPVSVVSVWTDIQGLADEIWQSPEPVGSALRLKTDAVRKSYHRNKYGYIWRKSRESFPYKKFDVPGFLIDLWIDSMDERREDVFREDVFADEIAETAGAGMAVSDRNMQGSEDGSMYRVDPDAAECSTSGSFSSEAVNAAPGSEKSGRAVPEVPAAAAGQESCRVIDFSDDGNCCMQKPDSEVDFDRESDRNTQEEAADSDASVPDADEPTFIPYSVSEEDSTPSGTDSKPDDSAGAGAGYPGEDEVDFEKECNMKDGSQENRLSGFEPVVFRKLFFEDVLALFSGELSEGSITIGAGPYLFTLVRESSGFKVCISEGGTVLSLIPFSLSEREPEYTFGFRGYSFSLHLSRCDVMTMSVTRKREIREDNPNGDRK